MRDMQKTKAQLIDELTTLRQQVVALETDLTACKQLQIENKKALITEQREKQVAETLQQGRSSFERVAQF